MQFNTIVMHSIQRKCNTFNEKENNLRIMPQNPTTFMNKSLHLQRYNSVGHNHTIQRYYLIFSISQSSIGDHGF
jgi:hypothetical protein